jgi:hypothetical protein
MMPIAGPMVGDGIEIDPMACVCDTRWIRRSFTIYLGQFNHTSASLPCQRNGNAVDSRKKPRALTRGF